MIRTFLFVLCAAALFGAEAFAASFGGRWETDLGLMIVEQTGDSFTGTYGGSSTIEGTVSGRTVTGRYRYGSLEGSIEFQISPDGDRFTGRWWRPGAKGNWNGKRESTSARTETPAAAKPKRPAVETSRLDSGGWRAWCTECGQTKMKLDAHRLCVLTGVASGGFNSGCYVRMEGGQWVLIAHDPDDANREFRGQTQRCEAHCLD